MKHEIQLFGIIAGVSCVVIYLAWLIVEYFIEKRRARKYFLLTLSYGDYVYVKQKNKKVSARVIQRYEHNEVLTNIGLFPDKYIREI
jgi:hypothetical protein